MTLASAMSKVTAWLALGVAMALAPAPSQSAPSPPSAALVVPTTAGAVRGHLEESAVAFEGVPYAAPPVGKLRWRPPEPPAPWTGVKAAEGFGPPCAQADLGWQSRIAAASSEDCLYLNVWTPVRRGGDTGRLPVIVFFPGGAYHGGSARGLSGIEPSYDGARLAERGAVVVTANYRLGLFGFLAHPELTAESSEAVSGNYALLDAIAVLQWVRANISAFGGDPTRVTAFGQSAGSATVADLMTSPRARNLFAGAILASGTTLDDMAGERPTLAAAQAAGVAFARGLGAPDSGAIQALRARSAADLLQTMMADPALHASEPRGGIVDGVIFPVQPRQAFADHAEAPIPIIVGSTARDGDVDSMGVSGTPKADATLADRKRPLAALHAAESLSAAGAREVAAYYAADPATAKAAEQLYGAPGGARPVDGEPAVAFGTDHIFRCGASLTAQWHDRRAPAWRYEFSHGYEPLGAVHLWDMLYVFGWLQAPADQPRDAALRDQMQRYLVDFARAGDPNGPGLPPWSRAAEGAYLDFASDGATPGHDLRQAACALYDDALRRRLGVAGR